MHAIVEPAKLRTTGSERIYPVILSGGSGTRLWPLSRSGSPKQFLPLTSERSLLQETLARASGDSTFGTPIVISNGDHRFMIEDQAREIGLAAAHILLEPEGRNTAPAIAAAAHWLSATDPDALMLIQPSDHLITDSSEFYRAVALGVVAARQGRLVTFGIKPNRPETGYGYIHVGDPLDGNPAINLINRFVEKPDHETAKRYVDSGAFCWNAGIFLFSARHFLAELERLHPPVHAAARRAVAEGKADGTSFHFDRAAFAESPNISVDRAVMEQTDRGVVIPVDMGWNDVGSWHALRSIGDMDADGNVLQGDVIARDCRNSYIRSEDKLVAGIGLDDMIVVSTDDAILIAPADRASEVADVVKQLKETNREEQAHHLTVHRPWGYYRTTDMGDRFQVKRIMVKPGGQLSLQKHYHRAEHWVVVQGTALVQVGEESKLLSENESVYIPIGEVHRLENPGKLPLHLIEVQSGSYVGEDDIVRLEDRYGRK